MRLPWILRLVAHDGLGAALASIRPTSVELLNRVVDYAELPEELFVLMSDAECRSLMRKALIQVDWFLADEQVKLCALLGMDRSGITIRQDEEMLSSEEEGPESVFPTPHAGHKLMI
jgi:hypothetical protein